MTWQILMQANRQVWQWVSFPLTGVYLLSQNLFCCLLQQDTTLARHMHDLLQNRYTPCLSVTARSAHAQTIAFMTIASTLWTVSCRFKSGSMRLGQDALVLTKHTTSQSVGFLSQTFLKASKGKFYLCMSQMIRSTSPLADKPNA